MIVVNEESNHGTFAVSQDTKAPQDDDRCNFWGHRLLNRSFPVSSHKACVTCHGWWDLELPTMRKKEWYRGPEQEEGIGMLWGKCSFGKIFFFFECSYIKLCQRYLFEFSPLYHLLLDSPDGHKVIKYHTESDITQFPLQLKVILVP